MKIISLSVFPRLLAVPLPMEWRSEQTNFPRGNSPIQFVKRRKSGGGAFKCHHFFRRNSRNQSSIGEAHDNNVLGVWESLN